MSEPVQNRSLTAGGALPGKSVGTIYQDTVSICVRESVLDQVLDYSEQDLHRELGGFLIGGLPQQQVVEICHFLPAVDTRSRHASLTFTHDTWSRMHREVQQCFPDEVVVGWHHTHPGFGVFLSGYDLFIQRNFFSAPWQVALVVDPKRQEFGFFQWRAGQVVDCGFVCLADQEERIAHER